MAYTIKHLIMKKTGGLYVVGIQADFISDIANLPRQNTRGTENGYENVAAGSTCYCIENKEGYTLSCADVWTMI